MMSALYFITGALGAGNTTLLNEVVARHYPRLRTGHVDASGCRIVCRLRRR